MQKFFLFFLTLSLFILSHASNAEEKLSAISKCDEYAKKGGNALSQSEKYATSSSGWMDKFIGAGHAGTAESFFKLIALTLKTDPASCATNFLKTSFCDDYAINLIKAELKAEEARKNNSKSGKLIFSAQSLAYSQKYEICLFMDEVD